MANDAWFVVKGLRAIGVDAHLILHRSAHVTGLPQWEEAEIDISRLRDNYNPEWDVLNENWTMPDYVHVFNLPRPWYANSVDSIINYTAWNYPAYMQRLQSHYLKLLRFWASLTERRAERRVRRQFAQLLQDYELIIGHTPFASLASKYMAAVGRPYIIYDAGEIRYIHDFNYALPSYRLAKIGYDHARRIIFTNVDTYDLFLRSGYSAEKLVYSPFVVDTNIYRPNGTDELLINREGSPVFLMPSRADPTKGNESVFYAFQRYLKRKPNAMLRVVNWGPQQKNHWEHLSLIKKLKIQRNITWLPVMNKRALVRQFNSADIVFDQFKLGALGTTTPEAMSCGRPVVAYVKSQLWTPWHKEPPPVANARTAEDIYRQMIALEEEGLRKELGVKGRRWVLENCEMTHVAKNQLRVYEETMRN